MSESVSDVYACQFLKEMATRPIVYEYATQYHIQQCTTNAFLPPKRSGVHIRLRAPQTVFSVNGQVSESVSDVYTCLPLKGIATRPIA